MSRLRSVSRPYSPAEQSVSLRLRTPHRTSDDWPVDITPEAMAVYRARARRRQQAEREALAAREQRAWELARQAADALRQQCAVSKVVVFGSLVHPGCFTAWADVD